MYAILTTLAVLRANEVITFCCWRQRVSYGEIWAALSLYRQAKAHCLYGVLRQVKYMCAIKQNKPNVNIKYDVWFCWISNAMPKYRSETLLNFNNSVVIAFELNYFINWIFPKISRSLALALSLSVSLYSHAKSKMSEWVVSGASCWNEVVAVVDSSTRYRMSWVHSSRVPTQAHKHTPGTLV